MVSKPQFRPKGNASGRPAQKRAAATSKAKAKANATAKANPKTHTTEPTRKKVITTTNPFSPTATSLPRNIPGSEPPLTYQDWIPAPARVHHKLDNITDYHRQGTRGWEVFHAMRLHNSEKNEVGKIIAGGPWEPVSTWGRRSSSGGGGVVRKDPDFGLDAPDDDDDVWKSEAEVSSDWEVAAGLEDARNTEQWRRGKTRASLMEEEGVSFETLIDSACSVSEFGFGGLV